jgi:NAD-dependent deacetylase
MKGALMNIRVLIGTGVSPQSGLGTFRDKEGLWARFDPMKLATSEAFAHDPDQVHAFYNMRRPNLIAAKAKAAHYALAQFEPGLMERDGSLFLYTQNIDDLHEQAGSRQVMHMHGELLKGCCTACRQVDSWREEVF